MDGVGAEGRFSGGKLRLIDSLGQEKQERGNEMFRLNKGHYGYLNRRKKQLMIQVGVILFGIIVLVVLGYFSTKTRKNLLTVAAVVSALPLANQLVVLIAVWKYRSRPKDEYEELSALVGNGILDTELIMTSKNDRAMEINYAYVHEKGLFCYSGDKKLETKKVEEYISQYLDANGLKADVFLIKDWKNYRNRLSSLSPVDRKTCDEKLLKIEGVLRNLAI